MTLDLRSLAKKKIMDYLKKNLKHLSTKNESPPPPLTGIGLKCT